MQFLWQISLLTYTSYELDAHSDLSFDPISGSVMAEFQVIIL